MKCPRISVVIDTYNYGKYVEEAIDSVLGQNVPGDSFEILVVDDGSTDDTPDRMGKFDGKIRYFQKQNGGQASAFNFGFAHARGEIVALLDADDVWLPDKLGRICQEFDKHPEAGMAYHRMYRWKESGELSPDGDFAPISGYVPESRTKLLAYPMMSTSCLAFRRAALEPLLPIPEVLRSQADAYLTALIIFQAPVIAIGEFLGKYRVHGANLFQMDGTSNPNARSRIEHRITMRKALESNVRSWLEQHWHDVDSPELRAYLKQWKQSQEADEFVLSAPSRRKYFAHLLEYSRTYREIMTSRHRLYSYVRTFGSLLLGYKHLHFLDDFQNLRKHLQLVQRAKKLFAVHSNRYPETARH